MDLDARTAAPNHLKILLNLLPNTLAPLGAADLPRAGGTSAAAKSGGRAARSLAWQLLPLLPLLTLLTLRGARPPPSRSAPRAAWS